MTAPSWPREAALALEKVWESPEAYSVDDVAALILRHAPSAPAALESVKAIVDRHYMKLQRENATVKTLAPLEDIGHALQQQIDAALAVPPAEATGWRAIESAPKDGTRVLVFADGEQRVAALLTAVEDGEQNWVYARRLGHDALAFICHPTLWQPLPAAPEPPLCSDCPPAGYPTDKTRCGPCPRRSPEPPR